MMCDSAGGGQCQERHTNGLSSLQVQDVFFKGCGEGERAGEGRALCSQHDRLWLRLQTGRTVELEV